MKRRHLAWIAAGLALAGAGVWLSGLPAARGLGQSPSAWQLKSRAQRLPKALEVKPYGLSARVPEGWSCKHEVDTSCSDSRSTIGWTITPDTRRGSARDIESSSENEEGGSEYRDLELSLELAGFSGYVSTWAQPRGGDKGCTFRGWRVDPTRGLLRLEIEGYPGCNDELLGIIASTTGPDRLPAWPDDATRAKQAPLQKAFADLLDDRKQPHEWLSALQVLLEKGAAEHVGPIRARSNPSVSELVVRRSKTASTGSAEDFENAISLAKNLEDWEPLQAPAVLEELAKLASERALALKSEPSLEARRFRGFDCKLTEQLTRTKPDPARIRALVERLGALDVFELTASFGCASVLFRHRELPESANLLEKRYAPERIPADVDYIDLAEFTIARIAQSALMKRHVLAMLANEKPGGRLEITGEKNFTLSTKLRSIGYGRTVGHGLPKVGTVLPIRVCDIYANRYGDIRLYADVAHRDSMIADRIAEIKKLRAKK